MLRFPLVFILFTFLACSIAQAEELRLLNGDRVRGVLESLEGNNLLIRPRWSEDPVQVPARYVGYYRVGELSPAGSNVVADTRIRLSNADQLHGRLLSLDQDLCRLQSGWGQMLSLDARMIHSVDFLIPGKSTLLQGVGREEDWSVQASGRTQGKPIRWVAGRMIISGGFQAAREVEGFPVRYHLRARLRSPRDAYYLSLSPYRTNPRSVSPGSYTIQFNRSHIFCSAVDQNGKSSNVWNVDSRMTADEGDGLEVDLYGDRRTGVHTLYLNGRAFRNWKTAPERDAVPMAQAWIKMDSHNSNQLMVSGMRLEEWSGELPIDVGSGSGDSNGADRLFLRNGDMVEGTVEKVDHASVSLRLTGQSNVLAIARDRVSRLLPGMQPRYRARLGNRDVECHIGNEGDRLVLSLDRLSADRLVGSGEPWKTPVELPREVVSLIRFNIYLRRRLDNREFVEEWLFAPKDMKAFTEEFGNEGPVSF